MTRETLAALSAAAALLALIGSVFVSAWCVTVLVPSVLLFMWAERGLPLPSRYQDESEHG
jgi:hypothetical protein